ncbi:LysR family transcriptional regulator [Pseudomonas sp. TTU2014-080ASC]|uniref:LysR family transcriptional regulator n=1 Tax=Pseudomonas sp. TTU2014-080ASC TaxID=1729724 RepID=UPI0009EC8FDD|nr:LysR family transcriptional regulator [Pseudomonas sp. TTU2014-080ASC]
MPDIRSLENFIVIARLRSFSKAAEHCNITTSGLSRRISSIEAWLGTKVLNRSNHQLELTDAGRDLFETAVHIVESMELTRKSIQEKLKQQDNTIRIATPHIMSRVFLPEWLPHIHRQLDGVNLSIISAHLPECLQALEDGKADFVLTFADASNGIQAQLEKLNLASDRPSITLGTESLVAVSAPNLLYDAQHKLHANDPAVSFLPYSPDCSLGWALERSLAAMPGIPTLKPSHSHSMADGIRTLALSGLGLAWLPLSCVRQDLELKRLVRAGRSEFDIPLDIRLVCSPGKMGTSAEAFWQANLATHINT